MFCSITSGALHGLSCYLTQIEVDASNGLPLFDMVGSLSKEVKEAKERVRVAIKNAGIRIPPTRITVNLSPANIRKEGPSFDLPIAVGVLTVTQNLPSIERKELLIIGELGLNGKVKPVKGILPIVIEAKEKGIRCCMIPYENYGEGAVVEGITVYGVKNLLEAMVYIKQKPQIRISMEEEQKRLYQEEKKQRDKDLPRASGLYDFNALLGQECACRAALLAASGFHHLLMSGPPGAGKTMLAKCMPTIMPDLSKEESIEVSKIHSIAGMLEPDKGLITKVPFLSPHHTVTEYAMTGGGLVPRPGLISLSHRGILFLDELPEFRREVLEIMRQPMEERVIRIGRTSGTYIYPASFLLMAAMNPCPCGFFPDRNRCRCTDSEIRKYIGKISGPIADRIDLTIAMNAVDVTSLSKGKSTTGSAILKEKVLKARQVQNIRYAEEDVKVNGNLNHEQVSRYCIPTPEGKRTLETLYETMQLSVRSYQKVLKVARTIADLEESEIIHADHITEAFMYQTEIGGER